MPSVYFRIRKEHNKYLGNSLCIVDEFFNTRFPLQLYPNSRYSVPCVSDSYPNCFTWRIGMTAIKTYTKLIVRRI